METLAAVAARVNGIHSRITELMPAAPSGSFEALLEAQETQAPPSSYLVQNLTVASGPAVTSAPELEQYLTTHNVRSRNGKLEGTGLLTRVSGTHNGQGYLLAPAARAWEEMRTAAAIGGVDLKAVDAYRSYDVQAAAHQDHLAGRKKANVLPPGRSEHGNGLAVDVSNGSIVGPGDSEWEWLSRNAQQFGWYPISNESWHWEFRGVAA